jgi:hypothetical protein
VESLQVLTRHSGRRSDQIGIGDATGGSAGTVTGRGPVDRLTAKLHEVGRIRVTQIHGP